MDSFYYAFSDLFKWVPDWQSGVYICILTLLIFSRRTRLTLLFLFASAYAWGFAFLTFQKPDAPWIFHMTYRVAGLVIIIGVAVHFLSKAKA